MEFILVATLIGVLFTLDTTHVLQSMISQPIFVGPVLGVLFGNLEIGLVAGLIFEVSFLKSIPVGAASFPENNAACVATVIFWLAVDRHSDLLWNNYVSLGILLGLITAFLGMKITILHRKYAGKFVTYMENIPENKNGNFVFIKLMFMSFANYLLLMYLMIVITVSLFYIAGIGFAPYIAALGENLPAELWVTAFLLVGFARMMNQYITLRKES